MISHLPENIPEAIDAATALFENEFDQLTIAAVNLKINKYSWSIAQNIQHIIRFNESFFPQILKADTPGYPYSWKSYFKPLNIFLANAVTKSLQQENKRKIKTLPIWLPEKGTTQHHILIKLQQHHQLLKTVYRHAAGLIENKKLIVSPGNGWIYFPADGLFKLMLAHELRHYKQARAVLNVLKRENRV